MHIRNRYIELSLTDATSNKSYIPCFASLYILSSLFMGFVRRKKITSVGKKENSYFQQI